jgi:endoplasmic reticulum protein 29
VRFDKEYSYGDEHDAWKEYAKTVGESSADLLSCDVGVSEYGDKDNSDLAARFSIKNDDFPQYRLWPKGKSGADEPIKFTGDKKATAFMQFVQEKAGAWIGLAGQLKEFDEFAKELAGAADSAAVVAKAEAALANVDPKEADVAKYYVKVMKKLSADADFVSKEVTRLQKMMDDGSVKAAKKESFGRRLNALSSFK